GGNLVANAFTGHFSLELGKGQQYVKRQPSHRACRVELLGDRHERHALDVEDLDQPRKIGERAGEPVDLVDDDDVDPAGSDIGEQVLQRRTLHVAAREPAIVEAASGQYPPLVTLAVDIGLAGLVL